MVIPIYYTSYLNELSFKGNIFPFNKLLTISSAVFMSLLMDINSEKYKSKYTKLFIICVLYELQVGKHE